MRKIETISSIVGGVNLVLSMALTAVQVVYFYKLIESLNDQRPPKPPKESKPSKGSLRVLKKPE